MPTRKIHNKINEMLLGKEYNDVNKLLDFPSILYGKEHRKYFHDKKTALLIAIATKDAKKGLAALIHQEVDKMYSKMKKKEKKIFELMFDD